MIWRIPPLFTMLNLKSSMFLRAPLALTIRSKNIQCSKMDFFAISFQSLFTFPLLVLLGGNTKFLLKNLGKIVRVANPHLIANLGYGNGLYP